MADQEVETQRPRATPLRTSWPRSTGPKAGALLWLPLGWGSPHHLQLVDALGGSGQTSPMSWAALEPSGSERVRQPLGRHTPPDNAKSESVAARSQPDLWERSTASSRLHTSCPVGPAVTAPPRGCVREGEAGVRWQWGCRCPCSPQAVPGGREAGCPQLGRSQAARLAYGRPSKVALRLRRQRLTAEESAEFQDGKHRGNWARVQSTSPVTCCTLENGGWVRAQGTPGHPKLRHQDSWRTQS